MRTARAIWLLSIVLALSGGSTRALAGPPFQTDDPEPVDLGHYEFYVFATSDGTPLETDPVGPAFEFNWGALPNTQLHAVVSFGAIDPSNDPRYAPEGAGPSAYGLLDTELGVKYRFIQQTDSVPEVGVFPMVELPTGSALRGLGVGKTWYKLPLWIQKDWGPWTTYGGGGYEIVNQTGYSNFRYAGWLLQRDLGDKWTSHAADAFLHHDRRRRLLLLPQTRLPAALQHRPQCHRPVRDLRLPWPVLDLGHEGC